MASRGECNFVDVADLNALDDILDDYFTQPTLQNHTSDSEESDSDSSEASEPQLLNLVGNVTSARNSNNELQDDCSEILQLAESICQIQEDLETESVAELTNDMSTMKEASGCKCDSFCLGFMSIKSINNSRDNNASLSKDNLDLLILGQLRVLTDCGLYTNSKSHKAKSRVKTTTLYKVEGNTLCRNGFMYLNGIGEHRLNALKKHYKEHGATVRCFNYKGRNKQAVQYEECLFIHRFISNLADVHSLALPGRVPGFKKTEVKVLPSHFTITSIWKQYCDAAASAGIRVRGITAFREVWQKLLPYVIMATPSTDLCWQCQNFSMRASNLPEVEKAQLIADHQQHVKNAMEARVYMNYTITQARDEAALLNNLTLGKHVPLSGPKTAHYSFDYAQQVHYPSDPQQPGPIYFKVPRKCGLFGISAEGQGRQVTFLVDEAVACGKGANATISYLHYFFDNYAVGERHTVLNADNCGGQNKNNCMMQYLAWRMLLKKHESIELNFLIAGHTKFAVDYGFGFIKKKFRLTKVSSIYDIAKVVDDSAVTNISQLVGEQDGTVIVPVYDWVSFFAPFATTIPQLKKSHQFTFTSPGEVTVKVLHNSEDSRTVTILKKDSMNLSAMPHVIHPEGLSHKRASYLYQEIREFCTPKTQDAVCPLPPPSEVEGEPAGPSAKRRR